MIPWCIAHNLSDISFFVNFKKSYKFIIINVAVDAIRPFLRIVNPTTSIDISVELTYFVSFGLDAWKTAFSFNYTRD